MNVFAVMLVGWSIVFSIAAVAVTVFEYITKGEK